MHYLEKRWQGAYFLGGLMICQFKNSPKQTIKNLKNALAPGKQREGSKPLQTEPSEEREVMLLFPNANECFSYCMFLVY